MRVAVIACYLAVTIASLLAAPSRGLSAYVKALADRNDLAPRHADVLFVGSATVTRWPLKDYFRTAVLMRGFDRLTVSDLREGLDVLALAYTPRVIVAYAGENDIVNGGAAGEDVANGLKAWSLAIHAALPQTKIILLSAKVGPARVAFKARLERLNALVADFAKRPDSVRWCVFVDSTQGLTDQNGVVKSEFIIGTYYLNSAAYKALSARLSELVGQK